MGHHSEDPTCGEFSKAHLQVPRPAPQTIHSGLKIRTWQLNSRVLARSLFKLLAKQLEPLNSLRTEDAVPMATSPPHCPGPQQAGGREAAAAPANTLRGQGEAAALRLVEHGHPEEHGNWSPGCHCPREGVLWVLRAGQASPRGLAPSVAFTCPGPLSAPQTPYALGSSHSWQMETRPVHGATAGLWCRLCAVISGGPAPRRGVVGRPEYWLAPGQAPFVPGEHIFISFSASRQDPQTSAISRPLHGGP